MSIDKWLLICISTIIFRWRSFRACSNRVCSDDRASSGWPELGHSNLPHSSPSSFECRMYPSVYPSASTSKHKLQNEPYWSKIHQHLAEIWPKNVISPFARRRDYILGHISAKCWWILIQYGSFWSLQSPTNIIAVTFEWTDIRSFECHSHSIRRRL